MQTESQRLRHWSDEIDWIVPDERQDRARAENEHKRNDRGSDQDRPADVARGRTRFARKNGDVFKSAQRADGQFAENIEAIEDRHRRQGEVERLITFQFPAWETEQRQ